MTALVLSDSHGRTSKIIEAFGRQIKKPDAVIFLGDGLRDISYCEFGDIPLYCVCGNCDMFRFFGNVRAEDEILTTLGGKKIMMTHGHTYSVKSSYTRICMAAEKCGADIVLFGHTHLPFAEYMLSGNCKYGITLTKPLYLFNPGSIGGYEGSFGVLDIDRSGNVIMSHGQV